MFDSINWSGANIVAAIAAFIFVIAVLFAAALIFSSKARIARKQLADSRRATLQCVYALVDTIDSKDPFTKGHSMRVAEYTVEIARRLRLDDLDSIYYIALLHDVGKIGIPDDILKRVGRLAPEEYELMKMHTQYGSMMLSGITAIPGIAEGAKYHHEHYDGTGYNEGLRGEAIPLIGRIIGVADAYDAMTSPRSYRRGLSRSEAINELARCAGTQFDPSIAQIMIQMLQEGFSA